MAWSYQKYCTNFSKIEDETVIKNVINTIPSTEEIVLFWGAQFVSFEYEEDLVHPIKSSFGIIGSGYEIRLKSYTLNEFESLLKTCSKFYFCFDNSFKVPPTLFSNIKIIKYKDFPKMITELEKVDILTTAKSNNVLRTDERNFKLCSEAEKYVHIPDKYMDREYEVDCLGSNFCLTLSGKIEILYKKIFIEKQMS